MYCPSCGSEIKPGERFCMGCGKRVDESREMSLKSEGVDNTLIQQGKTRIDAINEINRMIDYFSQKQNQYDEYDRCSQTIAVKKNGPSSALLVWGIVLIILGILLITGWIPTIIRQNPSFIYLIQNRQKDIFVSIILLLVLFAGIVMVVIYKMIDKRMHKEMYIAVSRMNTLALELTDHYNDYGFCFVGPEYTNPEILKLIANVLKAGRADTIKEAINVLLDDAHKTAMEFQSQLTAQAARQAANGAKVAAVFSAARFFL